VFANGAGVLAIAVFVLAQNLGHSIVQASFTKGVIARQTFGRLPKPQADWALEFLGIKLAPKTSVHPRSYCGHK
jgi:hypothetical protein